MTEQKAIKILERTKEIRGMPDQGNTWSANAETIALDVAISTLEEIQRYRELGTVEEQREAMEKQRAKKPKPGRFGEVACHHFSS